MTKNIQKLIVVPIDGSENALKSLNFINRIFGPKHNLKLALIYLLPKLPAFLVEESRKSRETMNQLQEIKKRNTQFAERILSEAKDQLMKNGFSDATVETVFQNTEVGVARDLCRWVENKKKADAIFISSRGRSRLEAFFTGEVSKKVLEFVKVCPVWMIKGTVKSKNVLLAVDNSENAMRAVDHTGFLLSDTDAKVTLFHSKRDLRRFVPKEVLQEFPAVQKFWQSTAAKVVNPYMKKAHEILIQAGLSENQISEKLVNGSRSAAKDILKAAEENAVGSIILGRKGYSDVKDFSMGSITRKVLEGASETAVCVVP